MISRRTFIAAGIAGGAALTAAYWWRRSSPFARQEHANGVDAQALAIIAAIVPAMLETALPRHDPERAASTADTIAGVRQAIAGLPPAAQDELAQLFALLGFAPARIALARVASPWPEASVQDVGAFLERWRQSRLQLLRSAYDALHQLVFAAWYGQPAAWSAIGYAGPPRLTS
jgi:hypothetical protein